MRQAIKDRVESTEITVSDDFFSELDKKLSTATAEDLAKAERKEADRSFSERVIQELHPVAQAYAQKLRDRGITARVGGNERGLTFEMQWEDGGTHGLTVYPDLATGRLKITRKSTDHTDGRRFSTTDGLTHAEGSWKPVMFENALKGMIDDYVFYAKMHGGTA